MATVGACAGFAAVCGSSMATAAAMGVVALPEMKKYKYDMALATGCIAAGGTMGILIPPSVTLIVYGLLTEQSVGQLFMAGIIPGTLEAVFYMVTIFIICKRRPLMGPPGQAASFGERVASLQNTWPVGVLFAIIMGGIYMGVFSPTEAGGIGAFGAFVFALSRRRLSWKNLNSALLETGKNTAMLLLIIVGANIFGYFLSVSRLPVELANLVADLAVSRYVILTAILGSDLAS
ncbi:unnamed protein product, partial [marine sediment metagenome]